MKKLLVLTTIFAITFISCGSSAPTTLTINNMSNYDLLNVEYASIDFSYIDSGRDKTKNVNAGLRYILFTVKIRYTEVRFRTNEALNCEEGKNNEFTFVNNTVVTSISDDRTNTLSGIIALITDELPIGIGDTGPGKGMIFIAAGDLYMECSGELGAYDWDTAVTTAKNFRGGGFNDWRLPDRGELRLMFENLHIKGLGGFVKTDYWSSSEYNNNAWSLNFIDGKEYNYFGKINTFRVRAVRAFTQ